MYKMPHIKNIFHTLLLKIYTSVANASYIYYAYLNMSYMISYV